MGPLISARAASHALAQGQALAEMGGQIVRPFTHAEDMGPAFVRPGLIDMTAARSAPDEEIFAPVLQVFRVADFDVAIRKANDTRFGLSAGLISNDEALWRKFSAHIRAGVVNWNRPTTGMATDACTLRGPGSIGQSPSERLLCGGLLRLSGGQLRSPGSEDHPRRDEGHSHAQPTVMSAVEKPMSTGWSGQLHLCRSRAGQYREPDQCRARPRVHGPQSCRTCPRCGVWPDLGLAQFVFPPHEQPFVPFLRAIGFSRAATRRSSSAPGKRRPPSPRPPVPPRPCGPPTRRLSPLPTRPGLRLHLSAAGA